MKRIIIVFSLLGLMACVPNKKISYLQDPTGKIPNDTLIPSNYPEYRLKPGDHIRVEIRTTDNSVTEIFKSYDENSLTPLVLGEDGNIDLPLVGLLNVNGKTMEETKAIIIASLEKYIVDPYVIVRFGGIRYIALGEFNTPGSYNVSQSRLTIFEAIANAGDLNNIADRSKITLIRQYPNGQQIHIIDVTDRSLVNSPFYYMVPGDQLYAEPLKLREVRAAFSLISEFGGIVTGLSSVILLFILANK